MWGLSVDSHGVPGHQHGRPSHHPSDNICICRYVLLDVEFDLVQHRPDVLSDPLPRIFYSAVRRALAHGVVLRHGLSGPQGDYRLLHRHNGPLLVGLNDEVLSTMAPYLELVHRTPGQPCLLSGLAHALLACRPGKTRPRSVIHHDEYGVVGRVFVLLAHEVIIHGHLRGPVLLRLVIFSFTSVMTVSSTPSYAMPAPAAVRYVRGLVLLLLGLGMPFGLHLQLGPAALFFFLTVFSNSVLLDVAVVKHLHGVVVDILSRHFTRYFPYWVSTGSIRSPNPYRHGICTTPTGTTKHIGGIPQIILYSFSA